jgi:hypothetical protein
MNFDTAVAEVQQILGWRSDRATEIGNALRYAQTQREMPGSTYPWFLRSTKTITTVVGTQSYAIPTGYIQDTEEKEGNVFIYTDSVLGAKSRTIFLHKLSWKEAQEKYFGQWPDSGDAELDDQSDTLANGIPRDYVLQESLIYLYPTPDRVLTVNWRCWAAATVLGTGVENAWLLYAPWVLIGETAAKLAADLGNAAALGNAQAILSRANSDLFRSVIHREEAGRRRGMGSKL